jgi:hypothetical protein
VRVAGGRFVGGVVVSVDCGGAGMTSGLPQALNKIRIIHNAEKSEI